MKIIITDLTRFKDPDKFCTAGVASDGKVIRPMPYLSSKVCKQLNIQPGGILDGEFSRIPNLNAPHVEDAKYSNLKFVGPCSPQEFRHVLETTLYASISDGFEHQVQGGNKCIPISSPPPRSLITLKVDPQQFWVQQDRYDPEKLKATFSDAGGTSLRFVSITDRGFFDYARDHAKIAGDVAAINNFIHSQLELYLRIGLSRKHESQDGREGYWIQLNGIYTFPNYLQYIRSYP